MGLRGGRGVAPMLISQFRNMLYERSQTTFNGGIKL